MKTSGREVLGMACISESHPTGCTFHHALISLTEMCQPLWTVDWRKIFRCLQVSRFINLWFICGWPKLVGAFQKYYVYVLRWNCFVKISFWCWSHFGLKSDTLWQNGAPLLTDRGTPAPYSVVLLWWARGSGHKGSMLSSWAREPVSVSSNQL